MTVKVTQYVKSTIHELDCPKVVLGRKAGRRPCGPGCRNVFDGWQAHIRVRLPDGRFIEEKKKIPLSGGGKTAAERWARDREVQIVAQGGLEKQVRKEVPTLAEFAPRYIEEGARAKRQKPSTIVQKQRVIDYYLIPRFGSTPLDRIDDARVAKFQAELASLRAKTVNNILCVLSTLIKAALKWKVIDSIPCTIEPLKVQETEIEFYEPEVYEHLVAVARRIDPRIELLVLLGGDAGLRCGEIIALEQGDVDYERGFIHIQRSEWEGHVTPPKNGRSRRVDLTRRLAAALKSNRHLRGDRVLWRDDGFPKVTQVLLAKWMRRVQRHAGVEVTGGLHILRHTFCSRLAMAGAPALAIKEQAGHASIMTTQRYMHLSPKAKRRAVELLDEMVGEKMETAQGSVKNP